MDCTQRYRQLRATGKDRDIVLGVLRRKGASFIQCVKAMYEVDCLSLDECKVIVHQSPAWSDEVTTREAFWDEIIRLSNAGL